MSSVPSEPSSETMREIGTLCVSWSFLEMQTELTLVGLLRLDERQTRNFVWRMGIRDRWGMITNVADEVLSKHEAAHLRLIQRQVLTCATDRNIIVHGLVHASAKLKPDQKLQKIIPHEQMGNDQLVRVPCWTIQMGEGKGRNYPISKAAVSTVVKNVQKVANQVDSFNTAHNFNVRDLPSDSVEKNWPKPLLELTPR